MQPIPYKVSNSLNEIIDELRKRNIVYTLDTMQHAKGRCPQYKTRLVVAGFNNDILRHIYHGAYHLTFAPPFDGTAGELSTLLDMLINKNELMVEEFGLVGVAVRTVRRKRSCTYCKAEIPRGQNYIKRESVRREINICRNCAEKELETIITELRKDVVLPPLHGGYIVQKW
jgi:hypothetical protein